jgi:hypothetical protein
MGGRNASSDGREEGSTAVIPGALNACAWCMLRRKGWEAFVDAYIAASQIGMMMFVLSKLMEAFEIIDDKEVGQVSPPYPMH